MRRAFITLGLVVAAQSCITESSCGCSPAPDGTVVFVGVVRDPSAVPQEGAKVRVQEASGTACSTFDSFNTFALTASNGRFRHVVGGYAGFKCYRLWAELPTGSTLMPSDSQVVHVEFRYGGASPDSVELTLQLRPAAEAP